MVFLFQLFHNDIAGGQSKASVHSWIKAEDGTATDKELTITLPEFREAKMTLKCEVKARREIAGRVSSITKSGEVCVIINFSYFILIRCICYQKNYYQIKFHLLGGTGCS